MYSSRDLITRRSFLKTAVGGSLALYLASCGFAGDELAHITGGMVNPDAATGHLLRDPGAIPAPTGPAEEADVVIIGGGISGLSALRALRNAGMERVIMLELEAEAGGNSAWGSNKVSAFPWAAHYIPVPDPRNTALLRFLEEAGSITGYNNGLPVYNEFHLCAAPEERLFINGYWQEGIIPATGISAAERTQIAHFLRFTEGLKTARGIDGKDLFAIPLNDSSTDPEYRALDQIAFADYLDREGYTAPALRWYLDYCCKDDFGLSLHQTSAWAGLHYFASRKGYGANARSGDVLTWPEGNGFLMEALRKNGGSSIRTQQLVCRVQQDGDGVWVHAYQVKNKTTGIIRAKRVIMAVPQFIAARLLAGGKAAGQSLKYTHTPWLVANLSVDDLPQASGQGISLCWDNVLYGTSSVGYVHAGQQLPGRATTHNITFYKPLLAGPAAQERLKAYSKPWKEWLKEIVAELSTAHADIARSIRHADIRIWGHGMIGPQPGFIWGGTRLADAAPIDDRIYFAHTDHSGISLFEEAFYQGIAAADQILLNA